MTIIHKDTTVQVKGYSEQVFKSPRLVNVPKETAIESLIDLISVTLYKTGHKLSKIGTSDSEARECLLLATSLYDEIIDDDDGYRWATFKELELAFKNGLKERYGKYYGLNIKTFCGWIEGFNEKQRNDELNRRKPPKKTVPVNELSAMEKDSIVEEGVKRLYEDYRHTKQVPVGSVYVYDYLRNKNRIEPHSDIYRKRIRKKAIKNLSPKRNGPASVFEALKRKAQGKSTGKQIENECKRLALSDYFEKLLKQEIADGKDNIAGQPNNRDRNEKESDLW